MFDANGVLGNYKISQSLTSNENVYSECEVFEATHKKSQVSVVLKVTRAANNVSRESDILNVINHECIVELLESFKTASFRNVMVFVKYPQDLQSLYADQPLESNRIQKFIQQMLTGLHYIHEKHIIHRDIKPENLMVDENDHIKIGDFGLARFVDPNVEMTPETVTLWYRPIEILLEAPNHSTAVDIWSAGCVAAELYRRFPLFRGESQINMLNKIISVLGKPTVTEWPSMNELPVMRSITLEGSTTTRLDEAIPQASERSLDLIRNMIRFDPLRRLTAFQLLQHDYFGSEDTSSKNISNDDPEFP